MLRNMARHFNNITTTKNAGVEEMILEGYSRSVEQKQCNMCALTAFHSEN